MEKKKADNELLLAFDIASSYSEEHIREFRKEAERKSRLGVWIFALGVVVTLSLPVVATLLLGRGNASLIVGMIFFGISLVCTFFITNSLNRDSDILQNALMLMMYDDYKAVNILEKDRASQSGT